MLSVLLWLILYVLVYVVVRRYCRGNNEIVAAPAIVDGAGVCAGAALLSGLCAGARYNQSNENPHPVINGIVIAGGLISTGIGLIQLALHMMKAFGCLTISSNNFWNKISYVILFLWTGVISVVILFYADEDMEKHLKEDLVKNFVNGVICMLASCVIFAEGLVLMFVLHATVYPVPPIHRREV